MNHLEFAAAESAALEPTAWEHWAADVERKLGHDLDGDQARDGYSLDYAFDAYRAGLTVEDYVARVAADKGRLKYSFATCRYCGQEWQLLDWGCALHHLMCKVGAAEGVDAQIEPRRP